MSAKKSFKTNPALSFISSAGDTMMHEEHHTQEVHDTHSTYDAQEAPQYSTPISKTTQGRKGQKLPRINMAFSPENLEYLQLMARVRGCSATEYVNRLIAADREEHGDIAAQAAKLFGEVKQG